MNTKQWSPIFVLALLTFSSTQALSDSGWYSDEDEYTDTVIHSYSGSPVTSSTSRLEDVVMKDADAWYSDEDEYTGTVIHSYNERPVTSSISRLEDAVMEHADAWYSDEDEYTDNRHS